MANQGGSSSSTGVLPKPQKSKRKISLPWFRQGSVAKSHPALTRQHTIDTPSSFQARLLRRQPSQSVLAGVLEMTWVMSDFTATNSSELSVTKGQQVEVVEVCQTKPDYCLVRMPTRGTDHDATSSVPEGLVPLAVLKQPPAPSSSRGSPSSRRANPTTIQAAAEHELETTVTNENSTVNTSSPVNKRRGFSGRKWLPPPLRKLSQGKVDKTAQSSTPTAPPAPPPLKKTGSDKRIKVPSEMGNKPSVSEGEEDSDYRTSNSLKSAKSLGSDIANGAAGGEEPEEELELPPPMKPIQEPILVTAPPPPVPGVAEIEDNPCKREQHSENHSHTSLMMRDAKSENAISEYTDSTAQSTSNEMPHTFSGDESDKPTEEVIDAAKKRETLLKKRQYVLKELVDTEDAYVRDLSMIVDGYLTVIRDPECEIPMPEDLKNGKDKLVFGNIEVIYEWHKNFFLKSLKLAVENPVELGVLFKRIERKLQMYVIYCKNKPVSEYIVSEYLDTYFEELRVKLGQKLQLCDLLIKPVQRIMKYQLMLKDILKYTERAGMTDEIEPLRAAYTIMVIVPKAANDMMDVGRLQGFEGKITAQGKLVIHGILIVSDLPGFNPPIIGKNKELHVFCFEQSIIFSEVVGKKTQFTSPQYVYKTHIQMNKMKFDVKEEYFFLESTDPNRSQGFACQAATEELQEQWVRTITDIIQTQTDFLKAIQSPIAYQNKLTKEASDLSTWELSPLRRTIPELSEVVVSADGSSNNKTPRRAHYVHKANTIGIPSENDSPDGKNHHPRTRRNIFEGFRNTLRNKHKSDTVVLEAASKENQEKNDFNRRWSDDNHSVCEHSIMAPGTQARLVCEWPDLTLGEVVSIIRYDATQGYLVRTNSNLEEIWLPAHILSNYTRKPWSFRFRKPGRRSIDGNAVHETISEGHVPEFRDKLKDITVHSGTKVVLKCRVENCAQVVKQCWKKLEPNLCVLRNGKFTQTENGEGIATMCLDNVKVSDSGTYSFTITNEFGSATCSAVLTITNNYPPLPEPKIQVISCSSVILEWNSVEYSQFLVQYCKLGSGEWNSPNDNQSINVQTFTVENLIPGETYSFRIVATQNNVVSLPSTAVTLPVAENLRWQQEQFKRRYIELEEIDRGRFSVVRLAKDRGTGEEVALKQITRRKQSHQITQAEYILLAGMQHVNIVRSLALFDNAPLPGIDTIVLELVKGPLLFKFICEKEEFTESDVRNYIRQLFSALNWLHQNDIVHLDVKPENVMVDLSTSVPILKLVDFGDSVNTSKNVILPPACLEFASPELVLGQPVGKHTDYWAAGVFLYVLLSGVSPFLDDSMEETTANILKCDYCFPDEYFKDVSNQAKELVGKLLVLVPSQRMDLEACLEFEWMKEGQSAIVISSTRLRTFMQRRHPMNLATSPTSPVRYGEQIF